jgi:2-dehydro-3-deoxyphosphogalactonate aldolase
MTVSAPWPKLRRNLVAILRGVTSGEIVGIGTAIFDAGIDAIEIPLNSPEPFVSIEKLAKALPNALVGAGTVLTPENVARLNEAGGRLLVSPNVDAEVLKVAAGFSMVTMPGVFTATEAFLALRHGASALKFFPASAIGASGIVALRAVLPKDTVVGAVGGVSEADFATYAKAGVTAFGLGSSLYKPGMTVADVATRAKAAVSAYDVVFGGADERPA